MAAGSNLTGNPLLCHLTGLLRGGPIPRGCAGSHSSCCARVKPSSRGSRQSQVLSPASSTEPGQPSGTPCSAFRSPVAPKAAPQGAQCGCGTTQPAEARGLHQAQGVQSHLHPGGPQGHVHPRGPPIQQPGQRGDPFPPPGGLELLQPGPCPPWGSQGRAGAWLQDREREKMESKKSFTC